MAVGPSGQVLDGILRSIKQADSSFADLVKLTDDLAATMTLWLPGDAEAPDPEPEPAPRGRFCNLDWEG